MLRVEGGFAMKIFPEQGVLPVIHRTSVEQAVHMAGVAEELGAKGAFVIDHSATMQTPDVLLETYIAVKSALPNFWLGINNLAVSAAKNVVLARSVGADGVWADRATDDAAGNLTEDSNVPVFFGGLAMKGPGYIADPLEAAGYIHDHLGWVDVAVTSGPGTGVSCPQERLQAIRLASLDAKLAIASGVDVDNVARHAKLVDYILVASSVETYSLSGVFVEPVLRELIERDTEARDGS